jgi:signal transduction histidine kinase
MLDPQTGRLRMTVGDDLLEQVVALCPYVCPIILTHFSDPASAVRAGKYGAYDYVIKGEDPNFIDLLDAACRKGVRSQQLKRLRHAILALPFEKLLRQAAVLLRDFFEAAEPAVLYLEVAPGGALVARPLEGQEDLPLLRRLREHGAGDGPLFVPLTTALRRVLSTRLLALARRREEVTEATLTERPGTQLLVPVQVVEHPDDLQRTLRGLLWLECPREEALDKEDARLAADLADCLADALAMQKLRDRDAQRGQKFAEEGLLGEVSHRICNPLQISQSNLEWLLTRLRRGDDLPREETLHTLEDAMSSLEQGIHAAEWLREAPFRRPLSLQEVDLKPLLEQTANTFRRTATAAGCQLRLELDDGVPHVELDPEELRYVLQCLLQNALEAILRKHARPSPSAAPDWVLLRLQSDPTRECTVLLVVRDSGLGFELTNVPDVFLRFYSTKEPDYRQGKHGLGLWEAKRLVEEVKGEIKARNVPGGGAEVQLLFPALRRFATCGESAQVKEASHAL